MQTAHPSEIIFDRSKTFQQKIIETRPWDRFFARFVDYALFTCFLILIGHFLLPNWNWKRAGLFLPIEFLMWVPIEALLISNWGTTPGKWLLRTKVRSIEGQKLDYKRALHRAFSIWFRGICMGIPFLKPIAMITAQSKLKSQGITSWDKEGKIAVIHEPMKGRLRVLLAVGIIFFGYFLNGYHDRNFQHSGETESHQIQERL